MSFKYPKIYRNLFSLEKKNRLLYQKKKSLQFWWWKWTPFYGGVVLVWFETSLHPVQFSWLSCPWPSKLMTSPWDVRLSVVSLYFLIWCDIYPLHLFPPWSHQGNNFYHCCSVIYCQSTSWHNDHHFSLVRITINQESIPFEECGVLISHWTKA